MSEVKFHTKPTQINRENPILIIDHEYHKLWVYPLVNGFYAGFMVHENGMAECSIVGINLNGIYGAHWFNQWSIDVHTRQDLVNFVKTHDEWTEEEIVFGFNDDLTPE